MSKVWVLSRDRFPGERAHSINQIRMSDGFADSGLAVKLLFPDHPFRFSGSIDEFYGVRNEIEYCPLPCSYFKSLVPVQKGGRGWFGRYGERINTDIVGLSTSWSILATLYREVRNGSLMDGDIIYGRSAYFSLIGAKLLTRLLGRKVKVAVEIHIPPAGRLGLLSLLVRQLDYIFVISGNLKTYFVERGYKKVEILPDGVDVASIGRFTSESKKANREKLNIPAGDKVICYAGHLYPYKGVEDLLDAAGKLANVTVLIIGGMDGDVARCKRYVDDRGYRNICFIGFVRPVEIMHYLSVADICVYTLKPDASIKDYTSPIKLFEYLASGNAIVAADVPGVREVISPGKNGELYDPGNVGQLTAQLERLVNNDERRRKLGEAGLASVHTFSWTARASKVLEVLCSSSVIHRPTHKHDSDGT